MEELRDLKIRASQLKHTGQYDTALAIRLRLEQRQIEAEATVEDRALNLNWIAYLGVRCGNLKEAERAARQCLRTYGPIAAPDDPTLATYISMLAMVLAESSQFDDAICFAETAIDRFVQSGHDAAFVEARRYEVARMRRGEPGPYLERSPTTSPPSPES